jgi:hypothetical protein
MTWQAFAHQLPQVALQDTTLEPAVFAREELIRYLTMILGSNIADDDRTRPLIQLSVQPDPVSEDSYGWHAQGRTLNLFGGSARGLVFGVYAFLRIVGGCSFAAPGPDAEHVPRRRSIHCSEHPVRHRPQLAYRGLQFSAIDAPALLQNQIDWMAKNGLNYAMVMFAPPEALGVDDLDPQTGAPVNDGNIYRITESWFEQYLQPSLRQRGLMVDVNHHNLRFWLPPQRYFADHPEWYALIDGQRGQHFSQLCICTSNDEAVQELIAQVRAFLRRCPEIKSVGVIPEDGHGMCQCERCIASDADPKEAFAPPRDNRNAKGEKPCLMRRYARLLNRVAQALRPEFPDVRLVGAAYVDVQWPPRGITLDPTLSIWMALYWRDGSRPLAPQGTSELNQFFYDILRQWRQTQPVALSVYEYYMGMNAQCSLPYPMSKVICQDWPHLKALGIEGATVQMLASCHQAYALNMLAFARCGWESDVDHAALLDEFLSGMFGQAGPAVRHYYQGLIDAMDRFAADPDRVLQPDGKNITYFMKHVDPRRAMEAAQASATSSRELRQVARFAQYVRYLELAAAMDHDAVIEYLDQVDAPGWFAPSARRRWIQNRQRLQQQTAGA